MSTYSTYKYVPRFIIQKGRRQQLARKSETDVSESRHARECDMRVSMHEIALSSIFFLYWHTASHKRIPSKTATSGPSEHPEAERRGGEAADCARSTSFDLNVMRCMRIAKKYTRKRHIHRSLYITDTVSLCWQQETRRDLSMSKIFQEV